MTRELERSAAFLGAQFASEGATGFDIAALLFELRDEFPGVVDKLFRAKGLEAAEFAQYAGSAAAVFYGLG